MKNSIIAIQSFVITTIVYALLVPVFFEMDNAFGEEKNFVDDGNYETTYSYSQQVVESECKSPCTYSYSQQVVESECKSPCSFSAEMCIAMCA